MFKVQLVVVPGSILLSDEKNKGDGMEYLEKLKIMEKFMKLFLILLYKSILEKSYLWTSKIKQSF
jgi:hypothetical protein